MTEFTFFLLKYPFKCIKLTSVSTYIFYLKVLLVADLVWIFETVASAQELPACFQGQAVQELLTFSD